MIRSFRKPNNRNLSVILTFVMSDWLKSFRGSQRSQGALNGITEAINESDDTSSFDPQGLTFQLLLTLINIDIL